MRGATSRIDDLTSVVQISIHAPHAGSDALSGLNPTASLDFNPRPPCGERLEDNAVAVDYIEFQSTPPMRGATK